MEVLDISRLIDISDGDFAFVKDVLAEYEGVVPVLLDQIEQALAEQNGLELQCRAHDLKGSSRTVGAMQIAEHAEKLEKAAKHEAWQECAELLVLVQKSWEKTRTAVQSAA